MPEASKTTPIGRFWRWTRRWNLRGGWGPPLNVTGTAFTAGSGPIVFEQMMSAETDHQLLAWGSVACGLGVVLLILGTAVSRSARKRLGIFIPIFPVGPTHDRVRIDNEVLAFESWVREIHPGAYLLPRLVETVTTDSELKSLVSDIWRQMDTAHTLVGARSLQVTLWLGGRLDVCFLLGWHFHGRVDRTGPFWLISNAIDPDEPPCAYDHDGALQSPAWRPPGTTQLGTLPPDLPAAGELALDRTPGEIRSTLWCRSHDTWIECDHGAGFHNGDLILGVDTHAKENSPGSRVPTTLLLSPFLADDALLALVTIPVVGGTPADSAAVVRSAYDAYTTARERCGPQVRQIAALACTTVIAGLLGSRLHLQRHWRTVAVASSGYDLTFSTN